VLNPFAARYLSENKVVESGRNEGEETSRKRQQMGKAAQRRELIQTPGGNESTILLRKQRSKWLPALQKSIKLKTGGEHSSYFFLFLPPPRPATESLTAEENISNRNASPAECSRIITERFSRKVRDGD
jgi:hypothetical protein